MMNDTHTAGGIVCPICEARKSFDELVDMVMDAGAANGGGVVLRVVRRRRNSRGELVITDGKLWSADRERLETVCRRYRCRTTIHRSPTAPMYMANIYGEPLQRLLADRIG